MHAFKNLAEWFTGSKKTKLEDEAMDRAQEKVEKALEGLKASNRQLSESLKDAELYVRRRDS